MMNLGNYQINAHEDVFHRITLEIRTKLETITKEQYVRITMSVLQYMGREGFFDKRLPNQLAIYNKFGQLQRVEDMA